MVEETVMKYILLRGEHARIKFGNCWFEVRLSRTLVIPRKSECLNSLKCKTVGLKPEKQNNNNNKLNNKLGICSAYF